MSDSRPFEASYHGTCAGCEEHINPGDLVWYVDDELQHVDCSPFSEKEKPAICPICYLTIPCEHTEGPT